MDVGEIARKIKDYVNADIPLIRLIPVATQISNYLDEVSKEILQGNLDYETVRTELIEILKPALEHGLKLQGDLDTVSEKLADSLVSYLKYRVSLSQGSIRLSKRRGFFS